MLRCHSVLLLVSLVHHLNCVFFAHGFTTNVYKLNFSKYHNKSQIDSHKFDLISLSEDLRRRIDCVLKKSKSYVALTAIFSIFTLTDLPFTSKADNIATSAVSSTLLNEVWQLVSDNFYDDSFNGNNWDLIKINYEKSLMKGVDESSLIKDMIAKLGDKYTRLLDKSTFESLWKYDAIGVGLLFQSDPGKPMIVASQPIKGSSGYDAGLVKGDVVYAINGESTEKMTALQFLDRMSNDDSESITVEYSSKYSNDRKSVVLKRSLEKTLNPVSYSVYSNPSNVKVGYIKLKEFNSQAVNGLEVALKSIAEQSVDELVLDLRGNTGGGFQFALNIGGMFMSDKVMATAQGKNHEENVFKTSYPNGVLWGENNKPVVLLVDALSASASEVLAGGLHDNCRAVIAGEKTFGKGKIQAVFGLSDGEGLTMTVAQYVSPKGTVIQSKGLEPDLPLPLTNAYVNYFLGPIAPGPNLQVFDVNVVKDILNSCSPS